MSLRKIGKVMVCTGHFDRNGERKPLWEEVGSLLENERGAQFVSLKRTFSAAGVPLVENGSNVREVMCCIFPLEK